MLGLVCNSVTASFSFALPVIAKGENPWVLAVKYRYVSSFPDAVLHQLDQKIIYPHYDFKHLTEKYFEIGMKLDDFLIQLVKY